MRPVGNMVADGVIERGCLCVCDNLIRVLFGGIHEMIIPGETVNGGEGMLTHARVVRESEHTIQLPTR